jgi:hypothetical protein
MEWSEAARRNILFEIERLLTDRSVVESVANDRSVVSALSGT